MEDIYKVTMGSVQRVIDKISAKEANRNWAELTGLTWGDRKMATWGNIESDELKITQVANGFILKTPNSVFIFTSMKALFAHITQFYKDKAKDDE